MTGFAADGVWLTGVFGDVGVDEVDDVGTDGCTHDIRDWEGGGSVSGHVTFNGVDSDERTSCGGGHCCVCVCSERK